MTWQLILLIAGLVICAGGWRAVLRFVSGVLCVLLCVLALGALGAGGVALNNYYKKEQEKRLVQERAKKDLEDQRQWVKKHGTDGIVPEEYIDWEATARDELKREGKIE